MVDPLAVDDLRRRRVEKVVVRLRELCDKLAIEASDFDRVVN
jgi:hypothetical protein